MRKIFSIGYGDKKFKHLVDILKNNDIELVVDVRSFPKSKWPEFKKKNLERSLPKREIDYVHIRKLGGYRDEGYQNYMKSENFQEGLEELSELARNRMTAIMCLESFPSGCHRRFISKKLKELGWEVIHLVGKNGKLQSMK